MRDVNSLISLVAQMYKIGIKIDSFTIDKKIVIKLSIPKTSYLYKKSLEQSRQELMTETNEVLNKIFANIPLEVLFRVRNEDFSEKDGLEAEQQTFSEFKGFEA